MVGFFIMNDNDISPADFIAGVLAIELTTVQRQLFDNRFATVTIETTAPAVELIEYGDAVLSIHDRILALHDDGKTAIETRRDLIAAGITNVTTADIEKTIRRAGRGLICRRASRVGLSQIISWRRAVNDGRTYDELEIEYGHKANTIRDYVTGRRSVGSKSTAVVSPVPSAK